MRLRRLPVWVQVGLGWCGSAVLVAALWSKRWVRPEAWTPQVDDPLRRALADEAASAPEPVAIPPAAVGAVLALGYAANVHDARFWLDQCIARGVPHHVADQLWSAWRAEHRATFLHLHDPAREDTDPL